MYIPNHPIAESILKKWCASQNQPQTHYCGGCGKSLDGETIYEDRFYAYLCKDCLLMLHEKDVW